MLQEKMEDRNRNEDKDYGDDEAEDDDADDDDNGGPTVAERLRQLQQALDDEEKEQEVDGLVEAETGAKSIAAVAVAGVNFVPKTATVPSLTQVLVQALRSADDNLLELVLQVKAATLIQPTLQSLSDEDLLLLFTALTSRLIKKPNRLVAAAEHSTGPGSPLSQWIMLVLQTGRIRSTRHLQPLRNLIQERVEIFPELLQLEGRLSILAGPFGAGGNSAAATAASAFGSAQ
jgi:hypothetical protein